METIFDNKDVRELREQIAADSAALSCDNALLTRRQVSILLGYSYSGVGPLLKDPDFPPPVVISSAKRWRCRDVVAWVDRKRMEFS